MEDDADAVDALFAEAFALLESASPEPSAKISSSSSSSSWSAASASSSPSISAHSSTAPSFSPSGSHSPQAPASTLSSPFSSLQLDDALPLAARKRARGGERETSAAKLKRMIQMTKDEHSQLAACLDALRGAVAPPLVALRERAMGAQLERRRAERERDALRAAVYTQKQFLRGMRGLFFLDGSRATLSVNLCHQLHNFTRLPRDKSIREHEYAALRREERVHAAIALLLRETDAISNARDFVDATFVHAPGEPSAITTTSVFVMDDHDVPTVLRAACVAVRDIVLRCRSYNWVDVAGEIVDADALSASELQYRVTNIRRHSNALDQDPTAFSVESRAVTMYRMVGDAAVVLWDFVDEDELHPTDDEPDVTRQSVGAALIRRERCPDGVERTVYRELSTRRYTYRGRAWPPPPSVEWYLSTQRLSMQWNELLFREIMLEQIAAEAAAAATARVAGAPSEPILR